MPIEAPNCATVLNTAPARPWVSLGKARVVIRFATVKITVFFGSGVLVKIIPSWLACGVAPQTYRRRLAGLGQKPRTRQPSSSRMDRSEP